MISLFKKYTDEYLDYGTDKILNHCYGMIYEIILQRYKDKAKNILEIGICSGASLCVWEEYFKNANIYGIDIDTSRIRYGLDRKRIYMYVADGTHEDTPIKLGNIKYDIIIDDGSHRPEDQLKSFEIFAPYIEKNGIYIIEDIQEFGANELKTKLENIANQYKFTFEWYDLRHVNNKSDDIVAIFYNYIL